MKNILWSNHFLRKRKKSLPDALKKVELFSSLNKGELKEVAKICYLRHYRDDEIIFRKDEPSYGIFIVLKGEVEIFLQSKRKKLTLGKYEPFEYFGEFSLVENTARKANAVSEGETTLCYIFREDLAQVFIKNPKLGLTVYEKIVGLLVERLEYANETLIKDENINKQ